MERELLLNAPKEKFSYIEKPECLQRSGERRNSSQIFVYKKHCRKIAKFFKKETTLKSALSELYARDMAGLLGLKHLIPSNRVFFNSERSLPFFSREKLCHQWNISKKTLSIMEHFILCCQRQVLKRKSHLGYADHTVAYFQENISQVTHLSSLINSIFPLKSQFSSQLGEISSHYFNQNSTSIRQRALLSPPSSTIEDDPRVSANITTDFNFYTLEQKEVIKRQLKNLDHESFQENFLLQFILGSKDAHGDNILIDKKGLFFTIDNESIMPERVRAQKETFLQASKETRKFLAHNVFSLKIHLLCLPHARLAFTEFFLRKALIKLNWELFQNYHEKLNYFSQQSIESQKERFIFIQESFDSALKNYDSRRQKIICLTPIEIIQTFYSCEPCVSTLCQNNHPLALQYLGRVGSHFFSLSLMLKTLYLLWLYKYFTFFFDLKKSPGILESLKNDFLLFSEYSEAASQFDNYCTETFYEVLEELKLDRKAQVTVETMRCLESSPQSSKALLFRRKVLSAQKPLEQSFLLSTQKETKPVLRPDKENSSSLSSSSSHS